jgi:O-antigen ligase
VLAEWPWRNVWLVVLGCCSLWMAGLYVTHQRAAEVVPLASVGAGIAGFVVWYATLRKHWALLGFYIVTLFWVSTSLRTRSVGDIGIDWQNGSKFGVWGCMLIIAVINYRRVLPFLADHVAFWLVGYLALNLLSTAYSQAPLVTASSALITLAYFGFAGVLVEALPVRTLLMATIWILVIYLLCSLAATVVAPNIAYPSDEGLPIEFRDAERLQGLAGHPNQLGMIAMYFIMILVAAAYRGYLRYPLWLPMGTMGFGVILAAQSRTPLFSLVLAGVLQVPRRLLILFVGSVALIGGGILVFGQTTAVLGIIGRDGSVEEATSMSGRTDLWQFAVQLIVQHPLLGYGYNSFESYAKTVWTGADWAAIVGPHNLVLSLLYCTGILGTLPWLIAFLVLLYRWQAQPNLPRDFVTCAVFLYGLSEGDLLGIAMVPTFLFFLIILIDAKERLQLKGTAECGG